MKEKTISSMSDFANLFLAYYMLETHQNERIYFSKHFKTICECIFGEWDLNKYHPNNSAKYILSDNNGFFNVNEFLKEIHKRVNQSKGFEYDYEKDKLYAKMRKETSVKMIDKYDAPSCCFVLMFVRNYIEVSDKIDSKKVVDKRIKKIYSKSLIRRDFDNESRRSEEN